MVSISSTASSSICICDIMEMDWEKIIIIIIDGNIELSNLQSIFIRQRKVISYNDNFINILKKRMFCYYFNAKYLSLALNMHYGWL